VVSFNRDPTGSAGGWNGAEYRFPRSPLVAVKRANADARSIIRRSLPDARILSSAPSHGRLGSSSRGKKRATMSRNASGVGAWAAKAETAALRGGPPRSSTRTCASASCRAQHRSAPAPAQSDVAASAVARPGSGREGSAHRARRPGSVGTAKVCPRSPAIMTPSTGYRRKAVTTFSGCPSHRCQSTADVAGTA